MRKRFSIVDMVVDECTDTVRERTNRLHASPSCIVMQTHKLHTLQHTEDGQEFLGQDVHTTVTAVETRGSNVLSVWVCRKDRVSFDVFDHNNQ